MEDAPATQSLLEEPAHDDLEWPSFDEDEEEVECLNHTNGGQPDEVSGNEEQEEVPGEDRGSPEGSEEEEEDGEEEYEEDEEEMLLYGKDYHSRFDAKAYLDAMYPPLDPGGEEKQVIGRIMLDWLHEKFFHGKSIFFQMLI
jgi:hypothetical protein